MEIEHRGETGDSRHDQFRTATEADRSVWIDTTETDFEIRIRNDTIQIDRHPVTEISQCTQIPAHEVVTRRLMLSGDIHANLFSDLFIGERSVRTTANNKSDFGFRGHPPTPTHAAETG